MSVCTSKARRCNSLGWRRIATDRVCGCPITPADRLRDLTDRRHLLALLDIAINNAPVAGVTKDEWRALRHKIAGEEES